MGRRDGLAPWWIEAPTAAITGVVRSGVSTAVGLGVQLVEAPFHAAEAVADAAASAVDTAAAGVDELAPTPESPLGDDLLDLVDPHERRANRRVALRADKATIEVRGLSSERGAALARTLDERLGKLRGVRWSHVNAVTGRVVATLREGATGLPELLEVIEGIEADNNVAEVDWSRTVEYPEDREPLLAAGIQVASEVFAIAVSTFGARLPFGGPARAVRAAATFVDTQPRLRTMLESRFGRSRTDMALTVVTAIGTAFGENAADGLTNLLADTAQRTFLLGEAIAQRLEWRNWESELVCREHPDVTEPLPPYTRPTDLPRGPIERVGDETAAGSLIGTAALVGLGRIGDAADALGLGAPKAARASREAYAASVNMVLARAGVLTLHRGAWRRLDRLTTLVIDGEALLTSRRLVLDVESADDEWSTGKVWTAAQRLLWSSEGDGETATRGDQQATADGNEAAATGDKNAATGGNERATTESDEQATARTDGATAPQGDKRAATDGHKKTSTKAATVDNGAAATAGDEQAVTEGDEEKTADKSLQLVHPNSGARDRGATIRPVWRELRDGDHTVGRVLLGRELDSSAHDVLTAARRAGLRVVLVAHEDAIELRSLADEFVSATTSMSKLVERLQQDGQVVAVLSPRAHKALARADVALGLFTADHCEPPWAADAICRDLGQVQRVLATVAPAREVSDRGRTLALSACALGGLLLAVTPTRSARTTPMVAAQLTALMTGARKGIRAAASAPPTTIAPLLPWHALESNEVLGRLPQPPALDERAIPARAEQSLITKTFAPMTSFARHLRHELDDPLTPILSVGAVATAILGEPSDAILLASVLTVNAVISAGQRQRAESELQDLLEGEQLTGRLIDRDAIDESAPTEESVPADALAIGDILAISAGDVVPADARLLRVDDLEMDESGLTGESVTVEKHLAATPGAALGERACMIFAGSTVVNGTGLAVVVAVGPDTQAGRAAAGAVPPDKGGVQAQLRQLTNHALPLTLSGGALVTALGALRGRMLRDAISDGVAVAVAAVPEGLPLVATVAQLAAARRLSRYGVLVRASRTVEALGRVDTLCFDKTGTLTEGRLRLTMLADLDNQWSPDDDSDDARRLLRAAARACPDPDDGPVLHATDRAVLDAAESLGDDAQQWDPIDEIPFESNRGYAAVLGQTTRKLRLIVKGAPEVVLPRCTKALTAEQFSEDLHKRARAVVDDLAEQGLRVLVVARRDLSNEPDDVERAVDKLTLLGFIGIADTPRPQTLPLVTALQDNDIGVRMITGDHPVTAAAVARQLGITVDTVTTGADLDRLDDTEQAKLIERSTVFARVDPEQKVRIVAALRRNGHVVGMTGDGSNDAAAIRSADIGIGLAARGSAAARNAADLVLTDPDPLALLHALVEGRGMWQRISDAVGVLVGGNAGEIAFTIYGTVVGGQAPLGTRQFLLVNMLTDMFPALALALSPDRDSPSPHDAEHGAEQRTRQLAEIPPARLGPDLTRTIAVRGIATAAGACTAWTLGRYTGTQRRAATIGLVALIGTQLGQTLVSGHRSPLVWVTTAASGVVLGAVVMVPGLSAYFGCTPLGPVGWTIATTCAAAATAGSTVLPRLLPGAHED
ncbi:cation-translocating P-type ATPase [Nocardia vinacea]|uniref:Cation-translocating P-type ATPase n=1 Tax=Nocardia vinacea TaxID=96468 RepID=A0ABZ1YHG5_9NOCA|nr:cation-translocating P-type ATPase [Nocardia vinacea]